MANMTYCMFENTKNNLEQISQEIGEKGLQHWIDQASQYELRAIKALPSLMEELAEEMRETLGDNEDEG